MEYGDTKPTFEFSEAYPAGLIQENHDKLLNYLKHRLDQGNIPRATRLVRYAKIDKTVSTWQKLTAADSERTAKSEETGQAQAVNVNLPLVHTHTEDMVAFFSAIYSPTAGSFLTVPDPSVAEQGKSLIEKMNSDAKESKYFKELCSMLRAILKYNIGGFANSWEMPAIDNPDDKGRNCPESIDMYNFVWDPTVTDPSLIAKKAEWAARFSVVNRLEIIRGDNDEYIGADEIMDAGGNGNTAKYYRNPPNSAGLSFGDEKTSAKGAVNWESYNASLTSDSNVNLNDAFERTEMYCWINPGDFLIEGINPEAPDYVDQMVLYKFIILGGDRIVKVDKVELDNQPATTIPYYVGYLNQDDMGDAQRSQAELMAPFQNYASFLINADVAGTRASIWGMQGYDPTMFNLGALPLGATSGRIPSMAPGRDVRSGILNINGEFDTSHTMEKLNSVLAMVQQFFPSQALPNQIAGIDRAVTSQVAAVMQGVSRRLHMLVRIVDDDIMNPLRMAMYMNIAGYKAADITGLTDAKAREILGSGLQQLNREAAAQAMQQLLFAVIQNPQSATQMDVLSLMDFWGSLLNMAVDLKKFRITQPTVAPDGTVTPPPPAAPGVDPNAAPTQ